MQDTEIIERIQTIEDALAITGRPAVPSFEELPEDMRAYFQAQYELVVITEAINHLDGDWKADWSDWNQRKYYPWFSYDKASSRFAFGGTNYDYSYATAGSASRLCCGKPSLAEHSGRQFAEKWNVLLLE